MRRCLDKQMNREPYIQIRCFFACVCLLPDLSNV